MISPTKNVHVLYEECCEIRDQYIGNLESKDFFRSSTWFSDASRIVLLNNYRVCLKKDLEFSLGKRVEQDLWNVCFKKCIDRLQGTMHRKDIHSSEKIDVNFTLGIVLDSGISFYFQLLSELCRNYDFVPPCLNWLMDGFGLDKTPNERIQIPSFFSLCYVCQYCLLHIGDLYRYKNFLEEAKSVYNFSSHIVSTNGHPYNQLAITHTSKGEHLIVAFYYIRAISCKNVFPVSTINLKKLFSNFSLPPDQDYNVGEFTFQFFEKTFLSFMAILYLEQDWNVASNALGRISNIFSSLLKSEALTHSQLLYVACISIFVVHHTAVFKSTEGISSKESNELNDESRAVCDTSINQLEMLDGNSSAFLSVFNEDLLRTSSLNMYFRSALEFVVRLFEVMLLSITPSMTDSSLMIKVLPAIHIMLQWFLTQRLLLQHPIVCKRSKLWHELARVLNLLLDLVVFPGQQLGVSFLNFFSPQDSIEGTYYTTETYFLQGFLPLGNEETCFHQHCYASENDDMDECKVPRVVSILETALKIAQFFGEATCVNCDGKELPNTLATKTNSSPFFFKQNCSPVDDDCPSSSRFRGLKFHSSMESSIAKGNKKQRKICALACVRKQDEVVPELNSFTESSDMMQSSDMKENVDLVSTSQAYETFPDSSTYFRTTCSSESSLQDSTEIECKSKHGSDNFYGIPDSSAADANCFLPPVSSVENMMKDVDIARSINSSFESCTDAFFSSNSSPDVLLRSVLVNALCSTTPEDDILGSNGSSTVICSSNRLANKSTDAYVLSPCEDLSNKNTNLGEASDALFSLWGANAENPPRRWDILDGVPDVLSTLSPSFLSHDVIPDFGMLSGDNSLENLVRSRNEQTFDS